MTVDMNTNALNAYQSSSISSVRAQQGDFSVDGGKSRPIRDEQAAKLSISDEARQKLQEMKNAAVAGKASDPVQQGKDPVQAEPAQSMATEGAAQAVPYQTAQMIQAYQTSMGMGR